MEAYFTFMIELVWGKRRILEVYLNVIEMGEGIFGIEMASKIYFNRSAKDLSRQQAALIAACLPSPKRIKLKPPSSYALKRSSWVMQQMSFLEPDPDIQNVIDRKKPETKSRTKKSK
jgi:monofunctional biosynthetic peptidoglycan transglycosylase